MQLYPSYGKLQNEGHVEVLALGNNEAKFL